MTIIKHNPVDLYPPYRSYSHAVEVNLGSRLLVISGLNGYEKDGATMPDSFEEQADLIWMHLKTLLSEANMSVHNIISLRTYLADPAFDEQNALMRVKHLEGNRPASTVICCRLLEPRWKLEIEAMAAH